MDGSDMRARNQRLALLLVGFIAGLAALSVAVAYFR